jgi:hypothetical protein
MWIVPNISASTCAVPERDVENRYVRLYETVCTHIKALIQRVFTPFKYEFLTFLSQFQAQKG